MAALCRDHEITLLTYGTVLGGLLAEKYLGSPSRLAERSIPRRCRSTRT
jgi:aryl-alcohol dehydrogenase-like predicted oxidoreductase